MAAKAVEKLFAERILRLERLLEGRRLRRVKRLARTSVGGYKRELLRVRESDGKLANQLFNYAVFLRGIYDFAKLCELTVFTRDGVPPKTIETLWIALCDCQDRIEFCSYSIRGRMVDRIREELDKLEVRINREFGEGYYSSPEIKADRMICSICNQDIRACFHISGRLYKGQMCFVTHDNPRLVASSLTKRPYDRRCRIWPWQVNGDEASWLLLASFFRLDDFMESDDWK